MFLSGLVLVKLLRTVEEAFRPAIRALKAYDTYAVVGLNTVEHLWLCMLEDWQLGFRAI